MYSEVRREDFLKVYLFRVFKVMIMCMYLSPKRIPPYKLVQIGEIFLDKVSLVLTLVLVSIG